jgi:hypothetical protein
VIFIIHTSFQLWHCLFPQEYLRAIHDQGAIDGEGVTLKCSPLYDFLDPSQRGEWLDILVALIQYLQSGQSKVGFLNNNVSKNMIHKVCSL